MRKIIVGIETSCDDTCVGVLAVENDTATILSNLKINQNNLHEQYGGIVPEVAARSHISRLNLVFQQALKESNLTIKEVDLLAYTKTPGLLSSLLIGEKFTQGIGLQHNIDIIGINHLKAHASVVLINNEISYPFLGLIISGGHTELWRFNSFDNYELLEKTADDAVGELFDKVGRCMKLPFPAGSSIEKLATETKEFINIPLPKILSFSGMKTKFIGLLEKNIPHNIIANSLQKIVGQILIRLIMNHNVINMPIVVGGGVASNIYLQNILKEKFFHIYFPSGELCTDNGIMIAWCGYLEYFRRDSNPQPQD
jgi:N6-L-threonylcarbamoyladenine synthase